MEETHQKKIEDLQRQHQRELEKLREEKDRLLAEETAATISGTDLCIRIPAVQETAWKLASYLHLIIQQDLQKPLCCTVPRGTGWEAVGWLTGLIGVLFL